MLLITIAAIIAAMAIAVLAAIHRNRPVLTDIGNYPFDYEALIQFVERADDAYILTHATMDIMHFSKFASGKACNELIEFLYRNPPKMFGSKKHRKREWYIMAHEQKSITLKKVITHRHVKVKRGIKIKLGDEMVEYWHVAITPAGFRVNAVNADSDLEEEVY